MLKKLLAHRFLILFIGIFLISLTFISWFDKTPYFTEFKIWSSRNLVLYFLILVAVKVVGILWPPLPGGIFTLGSIPILGWEISYFADLTGNLLGSSLAFYLGRKHGLSFLGKLFDKAMLQKIKKIKINKKREFESIVVLKTFTGSIFLEAICYAAGLLKVNFKNFFIASLISHVIVGIPVYYFAQKIVVSENFFTSALSILIVVPLFWKLKQRYFE